MLAKKEVSRSFRSNQIPAMRRLLVVDSHYSFEAIRERKLEESIICRDLNGFFEFCDAAHYPFGSQNYSR